MDLDAELNGAAVNELEVNADTVSATPPGGFLAEWDTGDELLE